MTENEIELVEKENNKKKANQLLLGMVIGAALTISILILTFLAVSLYAKIKTGKPLATVQITDSVMSESVISEELVKKTQLIEATIDKYYYNEYDNKELQEGMYKGLVDALGDRYSIYYTEEEYKKVELDTEGIFYGIGAYIAMDAEDEICFISGVMDDSPAQKAGVMEGDYIYMIDGVSAEGLDSSEVVKMIRGEEGTIVHLTMIRSNVDGMVELDVERGRVESRTVAYEMLEDNIGYIDIATFDTVTTDQFTDALVTLKGQGARGLIIDVRSNLGGGLNVVCNILRQILPEGIIVYTEDKYGNREEARCDGTNELDIPLVVLTNGYSASASEILTGAVKDYNKGTIIGTTTFGKGIVQKIIPFSDGSAVKLTISSYFTPSGVCIQGTGIEPDITVELDTEALKKDGTDNQLNAAIEEIHRKWESE